MRSWNDLREKWLKIPDAPLDDLVDAIGKEQKRLRGRFGDPHLFRWLAQDDNRIVWRDGSVGGGLLGQPGRGLPEHEARSWLWREPDRGSRRSIG